MVSATENEWELPVFSHRTKVPGYVLEQRADLDSPHAQDPLGGPRLSSPDFIPSQTMF